MPRAESVKLIREEDKEHFQEIQQALAYHQVQAQQADMQVVNEVKTRLLLTTLQNRTLKKEDKVKAELISTVMVSCVAQNQSHIAQVQYHYNCTKLIEEELADFLRRKYGIAPGQQWHIDLERGVLYRIPSKEATPVS